MRVCVYCGSSPGARPDYAQAAEHLGQTLVNRGIGLVYGGARVGLMGAVADAVLAAGGEAVGVIPRGLQDKEIAHPDLTELHVTDSMHARKLKMVELSDGFVALPGGAGTLDELMEVFTWLQLGLHAKPIGLLDVAGYWGGFHAFLEHTVAERFTRAEHLAMLERSDDADALLDAMDAFVAPTRAKWIDRSEEA